MEKLEGKEIPWEKQREILIEATALKLPRLYQPLIEAYGKEKGKQAYDELLEVNFKRRAAQFKDKDIGDIMMAEIGYFPALGWDIWIEKKDEEEQSVWYEHLAKCPHLEATRKYKLPDPCPIVCDMDCVMGKKYKVGKWQRLKHMPSGDSECCFRITSYE